MTEIKHIDARGEFVAADSPNAAYQVNMGDADALNFIERVRGPQPARVSFAAPVAAPVEAEVEPIEEEKPRAKRR